MEDWPGVRFAVALSLRVATCFIVIRISTAAANGELSEDAVPDSPFPWYTGTSLSMPSYTAYSDGSPLTTTAITNIPRFSLQPTPTPVLNAISTMIPVSRFGIVAHQKGGSTETMDNSLEESSPTRQWTWYSLEWTWELVLRVISAIVGILGNLLVIVVLIHRRSKSRSMDTLVTCLSVADLLTSIFVIPIPYASSVPTTWLGELYCRVKYTESLLWISITASSYILMAISIDRYLAVVYPLHFKHLVTRHRVSLAILVIWVMAVASGSFMFVVFGVDETNHSCSESYPSQQAQTAVTYYWFAIRLLIPCIVMFVTQALIVRQLNIQANHFNDVTNQAQSGGTMTCDQTTPSFHIVARNRVVKLMLVVILIYAICWTPNQVAYMGYNLGWVPASYINSTLHHLSTVLGFYNSCANPVIYAVQYPKFRAAVKDLFTCASSRNAPLFEKDEGPAKSIDSGVDAEV